MYVAAGVTKHYGGVAALAGVDLELRPGEVQALLGANGAGKSTLVKILVGAERADEGTLTLDGEPVRFAHAGEAARRGVAIVSQELSLFPDLTVLQNLLLGREPLRGHVAIDKRAMRRRVRPVLEAIGLDVDLDAPLGLLRLADQQLVEIARALLEEPKILVLDEPTSALREAETARLHDVVRRLREGGVAVVYVSHVLEDVFAIADVVTILRNGRVATSRRPCRELSIPEVVRQMLGETADRSQRERARAALGAATPRERPVGALELDGVAVAGRLAELTLHARPGEVVGLAGLEGAGPETVFELVFGQRRPDRGGVRLPNGRPAPRSMNAAVRAGVAYVPADRKRLGLMLEKPIYENVALVAGGPLRRMGVVLRTRAMRERAEHWAGQLKLKMPSAAAPADQLSGGNQQKVVFAKWLEADPDVVLLDDPTRGVDVGAKVEMHEIIAQTARRGRVVLYRSSDLEEMVEVCSRIVVFFQGRACGELAGGDVSEHALLEAINTGAVDRSGSVAEA